MLLLAACADPSFREVALGAPRRPDEQTLLAETPRVDEHEPLLPGAIVADGAGFAVLDAPSGVIRRFDADAHALGTAPLPSRATRDAASDGDGFATLEWSGGWLARDPAGTERALPAAVDVATAIFLDGGHLFVERRHGEVWDLDDGSRHHGRPDGVGGFVSARRTDLRTLVLHWSERRDTTVRVASDRPIASVLSLEPAGDEVVLALLLGNDGPTVGDAEVRVARLSADGALLDELTLPEPAGVDMARPFVVLGDRLLRLDADPAELRVAEVALR
jgi:hypothetical protein